MSHALRHAPVDLLRALSLAAKSKLVVKLMNDDFVVGQGMLRSIGVDRVELWFRNEKHTLLLGDVNRLVVGGAVAWEATIT